MFPILACRLSVVDHNLCHCLNSNQFSWRNVHSSRKDLKIAKTEQSVVLVFSWRIPSNFVVGVVWRDTPYDPNIDVYFDLALSLENTFMNGMILLFFCLFILQWDIPPQTLNQLMWSPHLLSADDSCTFLHVLLMPLISVSCSLLYVLLGIPILFLALLLLVTGATDY